MFLAEKGCSASLAQNADCYDYGPRLVWVRNVLSIECQLAWCVKSSTMLIRSYFAVKQHEEHKLEQVVSSSMAEAMKTEMK